MTKTAPPPPELPDPTAGENKAIELAKASLAERPHRVRISHEMKPDRVLSISHPHSDGRGWGDHLTDTFGTASHTFCEQSLVRLATITKDQGTPMATEAQINGALAIMGAVAPRDELETLIGEQIIAAHMASLDFMARARANAGEYRDSAAAYTNMATKASRAMATHIEALSKLRSGGKQTHEVRYVYVNGPAVFGDHNQTVFGGVGTHEGGGPSGKPGQPHVAGAPSPLCPPVWSEDAGGWILPTTGDALEAPLLASRRQEPRRADREGERSLSDGPSHPRAAGGESPDARRDREH